MCTYLHLQHARMPPNILCYLRMYVEESIHMTCVLQQRARMPSNLFYFGVCTLKHNPPGRAVIIKITLGKDSTQRSPH